MNSQGRRRFVVAAVLFWSFAVTLWVNVLDSGRSGAGRLLSPELAPTTAEHVYGGKTSLAWVAFEVVSYLGATALFIAGIVVLVAGLNRYVRVVAVAGVAVGIHSAVMLLIDRRPTMSLDLIATAVATLGCASAAVLRVHR